MTNNQGKILRIVAIILLALTALMNLAGGIGTVCAAFLTRDFPPLWDLIDYQWLYQSIMIVTIVLGLAGAWVTFRLFRGGVHVYRNALIVLVIGSIVGGIHMFASLALRGVAVPANVKFYINLVTFLVFLLLGIPSIRRVVKFDRPGDRTDMTAAGGLAAIVVAIVLLTMNLWAGPSHTYEGVSWINVLWTPIKVAGIGLLIGGLAAFGTALSTWFAAPEFQGLPEESRG